MIYTLTLSAALLSYLLRHLLIVEDDDKNLHEVFGPNLPLECVRTLVHQHVQKPEGQKHHLRFVRHQTLSNLEGRCFATTQQKS